MYLFIYLWLLLWVRLCSELTSFDVSHVYGLDLFSLFFFHFQEIIIVHIRIIYMYTSIHADECRWPVADALPCCLRERMNNQRKIDFSHATHVHRFAVMLKAHHMPNASPPPLLSFFHLHPFPVHFTSFHDYFIDPLSSANRVTKLHRRIESGQNWERVRKGIEK